MKKILILLLLASPVQADMRHSITTSAKVQLDAAIARLKGLERLTALQVTTLHQVLRLEALLPLEQ